jgi:hypothetical protein
VTNDWEVESVVAQGNKLELVQQLIEQTAWKLQVMVEYGFVQVKIRHLNVGSM